MSKIHQSKRWRSLRESILKAKPYCVVCEREGITQVAHEVDHIKPTIDGGAMWDRRNLQSICRGHHIEKTRTEAIKRSARNNGSVRDEQFDKYCAHGYNPKECLRCRNETE